MGKRRLNRETIIGVGELAVGVGFWATSGGLPIPHPTPIFWWIGFGVIVGGVATILYGLLRKKSPPVNAFVPQDLAGLIPNLQEMDEHLRTLAKKEALKNIDWGRYSDVHRKINKEMFGIVPSRAKTVIGAKKSLSKLECRIKETYKDKVIHIREAVDKMEPSCAFLDASGFGLKKGRTTNGKYRHYCRKLTHYRNLPIGTEINDLIRLHIRLSECNANILLTICRVLRLRVQGADFSAVDLMTAGMQGQVEQAETNMRESTLAIRARIGEYIQELEESSNTKEVDR